MQIYLSNAQFPEDIYSGILMYTKENNRYEEAKKFILSRFCCFYGPNIINY